MSLHVAAPSHSSSPRSSALPLGLDRAVLLVFSLALFGLSALGRFVTTAGNTGAAPTTEINSGELLAAAAIVKLLVLDRDRAVRLGGRDLAALAFFSLAWLVPHANMPFLAFTAGGLWLWSRHRDDPTLVSLSQVWLAVSGYELWGKLVFKLTSWFVVDWETSFLAGVGRLFYPTLSHDGIRLTASPDWFVYVLEGCSSFHNISLALLVWVCLTKLMDGRFDRRLVGALALGILGVFAVNVARILVMVPSYEAYTFWHEGHGATLASAATLVAVAVPTILALRRQESAR